MQPPTPSQPALCRALDRALRQRGIVKSDLARALHVNKSAVTMWTTEREPDYRTVAAIERYLRLRRGQLLIEAGYVERPDNVVEQLIDLDDRLIPMCRQMAKEHYRSLLSMSAEAIGMADNDAPTERRRMVASANS